MAAPLIQLQSIRLTFGGAPLLDGADLSVGRGERICLVGRNGSGKSTLLKIAAGLIEADGGMRFVDPGATVKYLSQEPDFTGYATIGAYVEAGLGPNDDAHVARQLMEELGLDASADPRVLSGGEGKRAALAQTLASDPDVLLLDEPTNHLDLPTIEWLEARLSACSSGLVLISHDRRFLQTLSRAVVWLDRGRTRRLDRGFASFEDWRDAVLEEEERDRHKLDRKIAAEEHWMRYGVTARRKRNVRRVGELQALRTAYKEARRPTGGLEIGRVEGRVSGHRVAELIDVSKAFGATPIVDRLSVRILRGDRIGLVGRNGAGKTTLLKLITGELKPDSGTVILGTQLDVVGVDQKRAELDPATRLADALTDGRGDQVMVNGQPKHVVGYMKDFLFTPEQRNTPLAALSGGERARVMLARALAKPANVLILDEPTNDLDMETLDLLEDFVADFAGTVILVSHDRDFIDRTCAAVIAAEGDGRWVEYAGGYSDMLAQRGEASAPRPAGSPGAAKPAASSPAPATAKARRKLSFKEAHELTTLPARIADLERQMARARRTLDDAGLYARDPKAFAAASDAFARAEAEREAAEQRWLELEILREELEAN